MKFQNAKSFRFSKKLTYILGKVSRLTKTKESEIVDRCLERRVQKSVADQLSVELESAGADVAKMVNEELSKPADKRKFDPRPRKLDRHNMHILVTACERKSIAASDALEDCIESEIAEVAREIVQRAAKLTDPAVPELFAKDLLARGVSPTSDKRIASRSARFKKAKIDFSQDPSLTEPKLTDVASGRVKLEGFAEITTAANGSKKPRKR